jgi:hypothetical protein
MSKQIRMAAPSLLVAALLASVVSTAATRVAARVANDCLNGPKHEAPPGSHWYYRIDRPTNRKCWFVGDERQQVSQTGSVSQGGSRQLPASPSPPAPPPQTEAAIQSSPADARAELLLVATPTEPPQWLGPTGILNPEKITEVMPNVSPPETPSPPSARDLEGENSVMRDSVIDEQSRTQSRTEMLPGATEGEPTVGLSAADTATDLLWIGLAMLLIILGLSTIGACLIFRLAVAVQAGRRNVLSPIG